MITIACVLKTGGWKNRHMHVEYNSAQVRWLRDQVAEHVKCDYRFVCLSDIEIDGVDVIPLTDDLPGWWSKMELFKHAWKNVFYIDLDTVIVRDITYIVSYPHQFTVLRNLSSKKHDKIGSGVMAWSGDHSHIYKKFMGSPEKYMAEYVTSDKWGDQGFIQVEKSNNGGWQCFQDLFPKEIVSYKFNMVNGVLASSTKIVCFHGEPKPWQTRHSWVPIMGK